MSRIWKSGCHAGLLACVLCVLTAYAQSDDEVMAQFGAYQDAIAAGEFDAADRSGEQAWRLAETAWGETTETAGLAFNLANLRVQRRQWSEALEPAQRALALHEAGVAGEAYAMEEAKVLAARAQLGLEEKKTRRSCRELKTALDALTLLNFEPTYDDARAWSELGLAARETEDWDVAVEAFKYAEAVIKTVAPDDSDQLIGVLILQGEARIGGRRSYEDSPAAVRNAVDAYIAFAQALSLMPPKIQGEPIDPIRAKARAWFAASRALAYSLNEQYAGKLIDDAKQKYDYFSIEDSPSETESEFIDCPIEWSRPVSYPRDAAEDGYVGAVLVEYDLTLEGRVENARVAAEIPAEAFSSLALRNMEDWRAENVADLPEICRRRLTTSIEYILG